MAGLRPARGPDFRFRAELDDAFGRQVEEVRWAFRVLEEKEIHTLPQLPHFLPLFRPDHYRLPADEVRGFERVVVEAFELEIRERRRYVGRFAESEVEDHVTDAGLVLRYRDSVLVLHVRFLDGLHGENDGRLVKHLVVLEVVKQGFRDAGRVRREKDRRALDANRRVALDKGGEVGRGYAEYLEFFPEEGRCL